MSHKNVVSLIKLKSGQSGVVVGLEAGRGATHRLESMGIRIGKNIKKISGMFFHGPVMVQVGHTQVGIGYGMASKVLVEVA
ncbi:hypothetical protein A2291_06815 [candidate division WOR-1 bacterium RIFOXYB2_FULL_42_35]|uniref:Ferrous iron transporter FeoA-like domain-containing protein n=1 Tax=candidate division WOR-1 bacterium RIFOXYC2_FULL_41_25 TaxID=1802586 RepID=A0A1F4TPQ1_UNCSA|nr:MAG: hypothetical protein A2291_06815 [candidate division WOR-1 bacterium RIFOXYB2_FULL_42_35]OGC24590.1 MAG: hypothetical protein A2247_06595 [candidate division WOR-1 bacterium RIFOXYA2_FULL_41_14]OGC34636.1 MAG: hypothetical protein A2462_04830 [candidate division WOR-1 bacterium RIFOXYC2_FULL_41_25]OGC42086.1 MAG: hypothetical protein A2548_04590 [candidate division WOR-1 bacterium RIFOXYD2_FULL_41_8]